MWFGNFFFKTLLLSLSVALRWLPVVGLAGYGAYLVFLQLADEPIALGMLFIIMVQPFMMLLALSAIRGGMLALRVTRGADIGKLLTITFKTTRFNLPLMWAITLLFGLGSTLTGLRRMEDDFIVRLSEAWNTYSWNGLPQLLEVAANFPAVLLLGWIFGGCVAFAAMGVSLAGSGAMATERPPNHHQIWGIGAEFFNLFLISVTLTVVPTAAVIFLRGGLDASVGAVIAVENEQLVYGAAAYAGWALCALAAAAAQAYAVTLRKEQERYADSLDGMSGPVYAQEDLRALRQARTPVHNQRRPGT